MTEVKRRTAALLLSALMAVVGVFAVSAATADNASAKAHQYANAQ